jgi:hypothetical protein
MFMKLDNDLRPPQPWHALRIEQDVLRSLNIHDDKRTLRPGDVAFERVGSADTA